MKTVYAPDTIAQVRFELAEIMAASPLISYAIGVALLAYLAAVAARHI